MSSRKLIAEFPDVEAKLQKPTRKSAFEKQKAEAEAKRQREAAETAAVYEDFVKSFDRDADEDGEHNRHGGYGSGRGATGLPGKLGGPPALGGAAASRRHFVQSSGLKSGPGSLGPALPSFGKKRGFESFQRDGRDRGWDRESGDKGVLGVEEEGTKTIAKAFHTSDDEEEKAGLAREEEMVAKPTLRLAHLPPGTSPAVVKALIPSHLNVEHVKILPPATRGGTERKCTVAIATLSQETPANEIDAAVSQLQNRYLGFGYNLSIHRHLSSAVTSAAATAAINSSGPASHPFGAKPVSQTSGPSAAQQHAFHRGFAPPTSYGPPSGINRNSLMHVPVSPPQDVKTIQMINMVIESVLEHGPEFEALLMSRPDVQKEEKWAWIWDARSQAGVWYRWRLWQVFTGATSVRGREKYRPIFEDSHAWKEPSKTLPFEYTIGIDEIVSDSEYNSSDDEDVEGEVSRENQGGDADKTFLNPLEKAKLTHLLSRLPTTLSRIRKGDVARVTAFAITHASRGADEVVEMIVTNIHKPFALSGANPEKKSESKDKDSSPEPDDKAANEGGDISGASLVGLYVVNDILSSSSTSGIRHAWRFRQLFETALKERRTFERLGTMAEKHSWGRLRAEKWKRSVSLILNLWEGWCVFPAESQELFARSFENPPELQVQERVEEGMKKGKWKTVEASAAVKAEDVPAQPTQPSGEVVDGEPVEEEPDGVPMEESDIEGEPFKEEDDDGIEPMRDDDDDNDDVPGEPMDDVEGEPMVDDDVDGEPMEEDVEGDPVSMGSDSDNQEPDAPKSDATFSKADAAQAVGPLQGLKLSAKPAGQPRSRMRAVDMFADSDDSDAGN